MTEPWLGMPRPPAEEDAPLRVGNASRGGLVCTRLTPLRSRWQCFRQAWRRRWTDGEALLLAPVVSVHAFGTRGGLRVHFLDADWRVLASVHLPRRRALPAPDGARAALLLPPTQPEQPAGDRLETLGPQPRFPDRAADPPHDHSAGDPPDEDPAGGPGSRTEGP